MGRNELHRPAPRIIQEIFDARIVEAEEQVRKEEEKRHLHEKEEIIKKRVKILLLANIKSPDTIVLKEKKPKTEKQRNRELSRLVSGLDAQVSRHLQLPRAEKEEQDYKFKVEFPLPTPQGIIEVRIVSQYYPEGDHDSLMRIDIPILPHTFDIGRSSEYQRSGVKVVSRSDHFVPNHPDNIGSPGRYESEDVHFIKLEQADYIIELLDFIDQGIADKSIKPKDLTPKSVLQQEAIVRQNNPQRVASR